jgi:signal transduction histidine kinase
MVWTATDITESKAMLASLQRRDAILQAVSSAAERFLKTPDWRQDINDVLETLGKAAGVDRAVILEKHTDKAGTILGSLRYEWVAAGITSHIDDPRFQNIDVVQAGYERLFKIWSQKQPVYGHTRDLPRGERALQRLWGVVSFMHMPIFVWEELWGLISFNVVRTEREWSTAEIEALQTAANILGTVIERQQAEEALWQYTERLRVLREIDQAILAAESPAAIAQAALRHIRRLVPCLRASVVAFDLEADLATILATHVNGQTQLPARKDVPLKSVYGIAEELWQGGIHMVEDLLSLTPLSQADQTLQDEGIRAYVNVPLISKGELIGSLNLGKDAPGVFTHEHLEIACEVADQLAITIQQARLHEQVRRHADELEQRVAERTAELEAANEHLQALSRVKDEFVSNVSHELRTPISNLKLYFHLLSARPDKHDAYLATLKRETGRLEDLIEGLLTLSRLDQDRVLLRRAPMDLNALAGEYVTDRTSLAESKELALTLNAGPELPTVEVDHKLMGQGLSILLTNALNYTPTGGRVVVSTQTRQFKGRQWAGLSVSDTGPGIPPGEQDQLFKRFFRGKVGRESQVSGTGLGLAIAREIVQRHHGHVEAESEGVPGQGATFSVWLPVQEG